MPRPAMKDCNLFFFDAETGGFSAVNADMVEVACVVTDYTGQNILGEYCTKVFPKKPVDPGAAAVNGYTREKWASEAVDLDVAMIKMLGLARDAVFVSHNVPFDWSFFQAAMDARKQRWNGDYHKIDTVALATPLLKAGKIVNLKLVTLTEYFGLEHEAHRAMGDARACQQVYVKLMEIYEHAFSNHKREAGVAT